MTRGTLPTRELLNESIADCSMKRVQYINLCTADGSTMTGKNPCIFIGPNGMDYRPQKCGFFAHSSNGQKFGNAFVGSEEVGFWPAAHFPLALRVARFDVSLCTLGLF